MTLVVFSLRHFDAEENSNAHSDKSDMMKKNVQCAQICGAMPHTTKQIQLSGEKEEEQEEDRTKLKVKEKKTRS